MRSTTLCVTAALAASSPAQALQTVLVPQQAVSSAGIGGTSYPWDPCFQNTCSIRSQYIYTANAFLNQGVTTPIVIHSLRWRAGGGVVSPGGITFNHVQVELSTA